MAEYLTRPREKVISWLPVDVVSQAILDVAFSKQSLSIALNIVHPRPSPWSTVVGTIADELHRAGVSQKRLPLIPFENWFEKLEQRSEGANAEEMADIVSASSMLYKCLLGLYLHAACY